MGYEKAIVGETGTTGIAREVCIFRSMSNSIPMSAEMSFACSDSGTWWEEVCVPAAHLMRNYSVTLEFPEPCIHLFSADQDSMIPRKVTEWLVSQYNCTHKDGPTPVYASGIVKHTTLP